MNKKSLYYILLILISPILSLIAIIKEKDLQKKKWLLIFLGTLWVSMIVLFDGIDGYALYIRAIANYSGMTIDEYLSILFQLMLFQDSIYLGIYYHTISYLSISLFKNPSLFYVFAGFVFSYLFISSIILLYNNSSNNNKHNNIAVLVIFLILLFFAGYETMQSIRTWTGLWFVLYNVLSYLYTRKIKYIYYLPIAVIFHPILAIAAICALLSLLFMNDKKIILFYVFILTLFLSLPFQTNMIDIFSSVDVGRSKLDIYISENNVGRTLGLVHARTSGFGSLHVFLGSRGFMRQIIIYIIILIFVSGIYTHGLNKIEHSLLNIGFLIGIIANIVTFIPALTSRLYLIALGYFLSVIYLSARSGSLFNPKYFTRSYPYILYGLLSLLIFRLIHALVLMLYFTNIHFIAAPILYIGTEGRGLSIRDLLSFFGL